jgi:hypothetical protein
MIHPDSSFLHASAIAALICFSSGHLNMSVAPYLTMLIDLGIVLTLFCVHIFNHELIQADKDRSVYYFQLIVGTFIHAVPVLMPRGKA